MPIFVLIAALAAYVYALITQPGFRHWGLVGGAAAGLGLAVYLWQTTPETSQAEQRIAADEIVLDHLEITRTPRGAVLSGRVLNRSETWRLREMAMTVRLRDCPQEAAGPEGCPVIGEASAIARPDVPPGQIRAFSAHFLFANVPEPEGRLDWDWRITGTRATE